MVHSILQQRNRPKSRNGVQEYLVQWAGYRPEWEVYRDGRGNVGDPISTWERESSLRKLDVFKAWKASQHQHHP